jgi:hypothetical protein
VCLDDPSRSKKFLTGSHQIDILVSWTFTCPNEFSQANRGDDVREIAFLEAGRFVGVT